MKTLTIQNAKSLLSKDVTEYFDYRDVLATLNELTSVGVLNVEIMVLVSHYDNADHFERFVLFMTKDGYTFEVRKNSTYGYMILDLTRFQYVSNDKIRTIKQENNLSDINKVKIPTVKKINQLFDNAISLHNLLTIESKNQIEKVNTFKNEFENVIMDLGDKIETIYRKPEGNGIRVYTKDFEFFYEIDSHGYINNRMTYRGGTKLEDFKRVNGI